MFKISRVLRKELIFLSVDAGDQQSVIDKIASIFSEKGFGEKENLARMFREREGISSTGVGHKIAIPHIFLENVPEQTLLILTLKNPVNFHSHDMLPVSLVLALVSNRDTPAVHLRMLAKLSRIFTKSKFFTPLMESKTQDEVIKLLEDL
ncbi:MAG: PTS sugar transporter subunit IIA [Nitrospinota bacterium]